MIGEARTGSGFKGLASYLARGKAGREPERVEWVEARNLPSPDLNLAPRLMRHTAHLSKRVKKPVYHLSVSFPEQENLGRAGMLEVADSLLADLGLTEHQAIIVAHNDTAHPHIHLVVNRVHPETGRAWSNSRDYVRIERSLRRQETERGLRYVPGRHSDREHAPERRATRGEQRLAERTGEAALVEWSREDFAALKGQVAGHFFEAGSWGELEERLQAHGLYLRSKGQGLILSDGQHYGKLSALGKQVRLPGLEDRFGQRWKDYDKGREPPQLKRQREVEPVSESTPAVEEKPARALTLEERRARNAARLRTREARPAALSREAEPEPAPKVVKKLRAPEEVVRHYRVQKLIMAHDKVKEYEQEEQALRDAHRSRYAARRDVGRADWKIAQEEVRIARHTLRFDNTLRAAFQDAGQARGVWEAHAREQQLPELLEQGPEALGRLHGFVFMGFKSKSRHQAERAYARLMHVWQQQRQAQLRHENLVRERALLAGRWAAEQQRARDLGQRLGSVPARKARLHGLHQKRAAVLRGLSERDIWQSDFPEAQKQELARLWEDRRVRDAEREGERARTRSPVRDDKALSRARERAEEERQREEERARAERERERDRDDGWEPF